MRILVTGATGYIGGRLVPRLLEAGHEVRVMVRDPERIRGRDWSGRVEVHAGDLLEPSTLAGLSDGMDAAYYLVHSMYGGDDFAERDLRAAENFIAASQEVPHVVYLGGLLPDAARVSEHLRSRAEVGAALRRALPTTEFRAGPIIGSGSASFEMIRYLTERVPAMVAPRWVLNAVQPIGVRDVLSYLLGALAAGPQGTVEVGADRLTFEQTMMVYAEVRGLKRTVIPLPVLAPGLAALWVGLVTPIPNRLAVPLVSGVVHPVVADTRRAREIWPEIQPIPYREAVERALRRTEEREVPTRWSGALGSAPSEHSHLDWEGTMRDVRSVHVHAAPERVYQVLSRLGGDEGWPAWDWAWELRGWIDRLFGGPGVRRGRRDPEELLPGDALDFWRVEAAEPRRLLRLRAEMKVPGAAWLEWSMHEEEGGTRLVQTARFAPRGLAGALYWYMLYPVHNPIFSDMVRALKGQAEAASPAPAIV